MPFDSAEAWKEEVMQHEAEFELLKGCGVDEEKRPKVESDSSNGWGISGAFRKLNIT